MARWAAKTAFMLNSSSEQAEMGMRVPPEQFEFVRTNPTALPPGVGVFSGHGPSSRDFSWIQENQWPQFFTTPVQDDQQWIAPAYKIALQFRRLLLSVAFWPRPGWSFAIGCGVHVPLWPQLRFYIAYPVDCCPSGSTRMRRSDGSTGWLRSSSLG